MSPAAPDDPEREPDEISPDGGRSAHTEGRSAARTAPAADLGGRIWRVRRRHDHIDAVVREEEGRWSLGFLRNDQLLLTWPFATRAAAEAEATARLRELQRAGWTTHW